MSIGGSEPPVTDQVEDSRRLKAIAAAAEAFSDAVPDIDALLVAPAS